jgi:hypothetical protein
MFFWTGLGLLILGVVVWFFGNRLWLMAAGAGALLGVALLRLFPGSLDTGFIGFLIVAGLAVTLGILGFIGKAMAKMIGLIIGFVAGGAIAMGLLDTLGLGMPALWSWLIALVGGAIGALLFARYFDWALIILASLLGSVLIVRGAMAALLPALLGPLGGLAVLALTALGIWYHWRRQQPKAAPSPKKSSSPA